MEDGLGFGVKKMKRAASFCGFFSLIMGGGDE